ncbi:MAG TPA: exo-alpha-sialidase [Planctomycetes bacterium]|nr:exo-alpha-sialidase [Planctomycetota bacterium]
MRNLPCLCVSCLLATQCAAAPAAEARVPTVVWDRNSAVTVDPYGVYPRMARTARGDILCAFDAQGKTWVRRSVDDGRTWGARVLAASCDHGAATNGELLVLPGGRILLPYNERPNDGIHPFAIRLAASDDDGNTWRDCGEVYRAGAEFENGCWEPAAVALPSGEIQLFFANEGPYRATSEQEITLLRSGDRGTTWTPPATVSFRKGCRDGMPVPLVLAGGKGIVIAIEDNGLGGAFKPAIVHTPASQNWYGEPAGGASPRRRGALRHPLPPEVYAGAPYIRQMPGGETVLSCQSDEGGRARPQMVVYVGDAAARNFDGRSVPFEQPPDKGAYWGSLFVKDAATVTAVASLRGGGVRAIDGRLGETPCEACARGKGTR